MSTRNSVVSHITIYVQYSPQLIQTGLDQRKLFIAAKEWLPKIGYREVRYRGPRLYIEQCSELTFSQRAHLISGMVPGLHGGKMSASDPGKISVPESHHEPTDLA